MCFNSVHEWVFCAWMQMTAAWSLLGTPWAQTSKKEIRKRPISKSRRRWEYTHSFASVACFKRFDLPFCSLPSRLIVFCSQIVTWSSTVCPLYLVLSVSLRSLDSPDVKQWLSYTIKIQHSSWVWLFTDKTLSPGHNFHTYRYVSSLYITWLTGN